MGGAPGPEGRMKYRNCPLREFLTHCSMNSLMVDFPSESGWDQKLNLPGIKLTIIIEYNIHALLQNSI